MTEKIIEKLIYSCGPTQIYKSSSPNFAFLGDILLELLGEEKKIIAGDFSIRRQGFDIYHHNDVTLRVVYVPDHNKITAFGTQDKILELEKEDGLVGKLKKLEKTW